MRCSVAEQRCNSCMFLVLCWLFWVMKSEKYNFSAVSNHLHVSVFPLLRSYLLLSCAYTCCSCKNPSVCPQAFLPAFVGMEGPMSHRAPLGPPAAARFHRRRTSGTRDERYRSGTGSPPDPRYVPEKHQLHRFIVVFTNWEQHIGNLSHSVCSQTSLGFPQKSC